MFLFFTVCVLIYDVFYIGRYYPSGVLFVGLTLVPAPMLSFARFITWTKAFSYYTATCDIYRAFPRVQEPEKFIGRLSFGLPTVCAST